MKKIILSILIVMALTPLAFGMGKFFSPKIEYTGTEIASFREELKNAKTIRCHFDKGVEADWEKGKLKMEKSRFSSREEDNIFTIDMIDHKKRTARIIGNIGAGTASIYNSRNGLTFIEESMMGNLNILTILPYKIGNKFVFVESRPSMIMTTAVAAQYYGLCEIIEANN